MFSPVTRLYASFVCILDWSASFILYRCALCILASFLLGPSSQSACRQACHLGRLPNLDWPKTPYARCNVTEGSDWSYGVTNSRIWLAVLQSAFKTWLKKIKQTASEEIQSCLPQFLTLEASCWCKISDFWNRCDIMSWGPFQLKPLERFCTLSSTLWFLILLEPFCTRFLLPSRKGLAFSRSSSEQGHSSSLEYQAQSLANFLL